MIKKFFSIFLLTAVLAVSVQGQVKIGYTNIELLLVYMPEMKQIEKDLQIYESKLTEALGLKEAGLQQRLEVYLKNKEATPTTQQQDEAFQGELLKEQENLRKEAMEAENKLMKRREEKLIPILEKVQNVIDAVAEENGYTYILNQTTSSGVSTILFGPEENDVSELLAARLGIKFPSQD